MNVTLEMVIFGDFETMILLFESNRGKKRLNWGFNQHILSSSLFVVMVTILKCHISITNPRLMMHIVGSFRTTCIPSTQPSIRIPINSNYKKLLYLPQTMLIYFILFSIYFSNFTIKDQEKKFVFTNIYG